MQEAQDRINAGVEAFRAGDLPTAIAELEEATRLDSTNSRAFSFLGAAYGLSGRYNLAVGALKAAEQLSPTDPRIHFNIAQAYEAAGDPREAEYEYEKALTLDANYAKAREALAALRSRMQH